MPPNTVKVCRPGPFGNPFKAKDALEAGFVHSLKDPMLNLFLADCFRDWLTQPVGERLWWQGRESDAARLAILTGLPKIRGKNLACWCAPSASCHADVLLELANKDGG